MRRITDVEERERGVDELLGAKEATLISDEELFGDSALSMTGGNPRPRAARASVTVGCVDKSPDDDPGSGIDRGSEEVLGDDSKLVPLLTCVLACETEVALWSLALSSLRFWLTGTDLSSERLGVGGSSLSRSSTTGF